MQALKAQPAGDPVRQVLLRPPDEKGSQAIEGGAGVAHRAGRGPSAGEPQAEAFRVPGPGRGLHRRGLRGERREH